MGCASSRQPAVKLHPDEGNVALPDASDLTDSTRKPGRQPSGTLNQQQPFAAASECDSASLPHSTPYADAPFKPPHALERQLQGSGAAAAPHDARDREDPETGADGWDVQDIQPLDAPTYLEGLREEQNLPKPPEEETEEHDSDAEEVEKRVIKEVSKDQEQDRKDKQELGTKRPVAPPAPAAEVMAKAAKRAQSITSATRPGDTFKMTTQLSVAVHQGCVFFNQYLVVRFLGKGACGKVYLVMDTFDNKMYALKITHKADMKTAGDGKAAAKGDKPARPEKDPMEDLRAEVAIMGRVSHPNVIVLKEVVEDPLRNKVMIVMNYAEGGPILPRKALSQGIWHPEPICRQYVRDILRSLEYLHSQKIIHGDLKPENVLLAANGTVKLSDFGCSRVFVTGNEYFDRFRGTPAFLAPEMMKPQTHYRGRPVDVYAMGVCLYALAFGAIPFSASNLYKLFQRVQEDQVRFPSHPQVSPELIDLLERLLTKDPKQRITIHEVMQHPWITMDGRFRMRPFKELYINGRLNADEDPPPSNYLKNMFTLKHRYVTFAPGTMVIQQGEVGFYLALITEGDVEVCTMPRSGTKGEEKQVGVASAKNVEHDMHLLAHLLERSQAAAAKLQTMMRPHNLYCIAQRHAGDILGEMALVKSTHIRKAVVVAKTHLKVALYTHKDIEEYAATNPGAFHQLKQLCWQRDAELMHFAALCKLADAKQYFLDSCQTIDRRTA